MEKDVQPSGLRLHYQPEVHVTTVENVRLSWPVASILLRSFAYSLDLLLQLLAMTLFLALISPLASLGVLRTSQIILLLILAYFLTFDAYFVLFEIFWHGQSPGKRALRLRVIRSDGGPVTWKEALLRQILRYIDFLPAMYSTGIFAVFLSRHQQRLGDMAAGTLVIRERKIQDEPGFLSLQTDWPLKPEEEQWLKDYWTRYMTLNAAVRKALARRACAYFHERYPERFPALNESGVEPESLLYRMFPIQGQATPTGDSA